jgi:hypothetical protein
MLILCSLLKVSTLFVRFNPDPYRPPAGEQVEAPERLALLDQVMDYWCTHPLPGEGTFVVYLFFDGFEPDSWKTLTRVE